MEGLKVTLTDSFSQCAVGINPAQQEVEMSQDKVEVGLFDPALTSQGGMVIQATPDLGYAAECVSDGMGALQQQPSLLGELCGQITASVEELGQSCHGMSKGLPQQPETRIVASIDGNEPVIVQNTWEPSLTPNPFS